MAFASIEVSLSKKDRIRVMNYLINNLDKIWDEFCEKTVHKAYKKAKQIVESTIDLFYKEYDPIPNSYERTGDLKNIFQIGIRDGKELIFEYGPEFMEYYHNQGNEFVYVNSFEKGYHGGSFGTDKNGVSVNKPTWRTPIPYYSLWYAHPAPQSTSPEKRILEKWDLFIDQEYIPYQKEELLKILKNIRKRLGV